MKDDGGDGVVGVDVVRIYIEVFRQLGAIDGLDDLVCGELIGADALAEQGGGYKECVGYILALHITGEGSDMGGIDEIFSVANFYEELSAIKGGIAKEAPDRRVVLHGQQQSFDHLFQLGAGGPSAMGEQLLQVIVLAGMECIVQSFLFPHRRGVQHTLLFLGQTK